MTFEESEESNDIVPRISNERNKLRLLWESRGMSHADVLIGYRVEDWLKRMKIEYPEEGPREPKYSKVRAFHYIATKVIPEGATVDDFPGDDSIFKVFANADAELAALKASQDSAV